MRFFKIISLLLLLTNLACAQAPVDRPHLADKKFDSKVAQLIDFSVPVISVETLKQNKANYVLLDAREKEEYNVSHIEDARFIGYKDFDDSRLEGVTKDAKIVLYCSVGYRSEKIGEKLQKLGYNNVYNLYGSIFEWVNQGNKVVDKDGNVTQKIHTYNRNWSQWVDEGKAEKVW